MASPAIRVQRSIWLVTLADLAMLLIGFFVFIQATSRFDPRARAELTAGIRDAFGGDPATAPAPATPPMAVDVNIVSGFATGSAALPRSPAPLLAWAAAGAADPRTHLLVTGFADGSAADVDSATGSALALAAGRAAAVAAQIEAAGAVASNRIRIAAGVAPPARRGASARHVLVSISFGE